MAFLESRVPLALRVQRATQVWQAIWACPAFRFLQVLPVLLVRSALLVQEVQSAKMATRVPSVRRVKTGRKVGKVLLDKMEWWDQPVRLVFPESMASKAHEGVVDLAGRLVRVGRQVTSVNAVSRDCPVLRENLAMNVAMTDLREFVAPLGLREI